VHFHEHPRFGTKLFLGYRINRSDVVQAQAEMGTLPRFLSSIESKRSCPLDRVSPSGWGNLQQCQERAQDAFFDYRRWVNDLSTDFFMALRVSAYLTYPRQDRQSYQPVEPPTGGGGKHYAGAGRKKKEPNKRQLVVDVTCTACERHP